MSARTFALPKYRQIAELIVRDIASGRLNDGERLPPERKMAADMGLSVGARRKALSDLEARSLLERVQGSGNSIRSKQKLDGIYAFFSVGAGRGGANLQRPNS